MNVLYSIKYVLYSKMLYMREAIEPNLLYSMLCTHAISEAGPVILPVHNMLHSMLYTIVYSTYIAYSRVMMAI